MIFGNIQNLKEYAFLEDAVKECFDYAGSHDLKAYEKGSHEIDGKRLFVNIVEYQTVAAEERFWEAHREYLDIHLMPVSYTHLSMQLRNIWNIFSEICC